MVVYHLHGQTGRFSVSKIQDWLISSWNRVFHVYKSVSFSEKRPPSRETGVKNDFEEMEQEIPSGTFCLEEQGYLYRCSMLPKIFHQNDPESRFPFTLQPDSPETFCKW